MGNKAVWITAENQCKSEEMLLSKLKFIETRSQQNEMLSLGCIDIFRLNAEPFDYLMRHSKIFMPGDTKCEQYISTLKAICSLGHKNIAKIHTICVSERSSICNAHTAVDSYTNYYALTFDQVIEKRKKDDIRFTTGELWYLLNSMLDIAHCFEKIGQYFGVYLPCNIQLTPEGYIKFYLYHLLPKNRHILYYHLAACRPLTKWLPIAPECLPYISNSTYELSKDLSLSKIEVFSIGMVAMEAMLFNSTRKYYCCNLQNGSAEWIFDGQQLKKDLKELQVIYPETLTSFIGHLIEESPKERDSISTAKNLLQDIRAQISINGAIKMYEDEENKIVPKVSYKSVCQESDYDNILRYIETKSIDSKLESGPIKSLSKNKELRRRSRGHGLEISLISQRKSQTVNNSNYVSVCSRQPEKRTSDKSIAYHIR